MWSILIYKLPKFRTKDTDLDKIAYISGKKTTWWRRKSLLCFASSGKTRTLFFRGLQWPTCPYYTWMMFWEFWTDENIVSITGSLIISDSCDETQYQLLLYMLKYFWLHFRTFLTCSKDGYGDSTDMDVMQMKMHYIRCVKSVRFRSYSDPHLPAFGLNTERYVLFLCIQSESEKIQTRITKNTDSSHSEVDGWCIGGASSILLCYIFAHLWTC